VVNSYKNRVRLKYLLPLFVIFFAGCSIKNYEYSETKIVTIKSPKIKFSDIGYIRHTDDAIELELFIAGHVFQKIHINRMICVQDGCMRKHTFNKEYLNASYPDDILQNIILSHAIYGKKNLHKLQDGFIQIIKNESVDIKYKVNSYESFFKDRKNHIIIKIRNLNGQ